MRQSARAIVIKDKQILVMKRNKFGHQFYSLIGGQVDIGEKPIDTVIREVKEEASLVISNPRLVIIEDAGNVFGMQYIFLCDYLSGEPKLDPDSIEAKIREANQNTYEPMWLDISDLNETRLLPVELKEMILKFINEGFPDEPVSLKIDDIRNQ